MSEPQSQSYATIVKSSFLVGGAQCINVLLSLVRVKFAAVILGPEGVGLIGLFTSSTKMLGALSGLGIRTSAVRDVSQAHGDKDGKRLALTVRVLRRVCWLTGLIGWLLTIVLSKQLSVWTFGTADYAMAIAFLGATIFFGQVTDAQEVLLRGTRRIKLLAVQSVLAALTGTLASIILYLVWGQDGIVPALLLTALSALFFSWWFARRVTIQPVRVDFKSTTATSFSFIRLGLVFMYDLLLASFVAWATQAYLANNIGVSANGIYHCAWSLSGQFATFILGAMATDFFPRLSAKASDHAQMGKLVNEQTEIGILLALPGLVATLIFAPYLVRLLYSEAFLQAADLLPWFVVGTFIRIIQWPMGWVQIALGAGRSFVVTQTIGHLSHLCLIILLTNALDVIGCAYAFMLKNLLMIIVVGLIVNRLIGFHWTANVHRLMIGSGVTIILAFGIVDLLPDYLVLSTGSLLSAVCTFFCLRGLLLRIGPEHWLSRTLSRIPFLGSRS